MSSFTWIAHWIAPIHNQFFGIFCDINLFGGIIFVVNPFLGIAYVVNLFVCLDTTSSEIFNNFYQNACTKSSL